MKTIIFALVSLLLGGCAIAPQASEPAPAFDCAAFANDVAARLRAADPSISDHDLGEVVALDLAICQNSEAFTVESGPEADAIDCPGQYSFVGECPAFASGDWEAVDACPYLVFCPRNPELFAWDQTGEAPWSDECLEFGNEAAERYYARDPADKASGFDSLAEAYAEFCDSAGIEVARDALDRESPL